MHPTFTTGLTIASNMIGSVTLVVPSLFHQQGILSCLIIMIFMAVVYCKTCQLWSKHQARGENDISEIVRRILGRKWEVTLGVSSGVFLILLCVIYFLLLNRTLYPALALLIVKCGVSQDKINMGADGIHFDKMSVQYLGIILAFCFIPLINLRSIDRVLVAARYGTIALFLYFVMIVVMFVVSLAEKKVQNVQLWAVDVDGWISIAGNFSLAFITHNTILAVTKNNPNPLENTKAITYGYTITAIIYALLGIFGGIAISTHNYFMDPAFLISKGVLIFLYISCIFGIFPFVSRTQFFCFLPEISKKHFYGFNAVIWLSCVVFQTLNVTPGSVISITGAGVGLFVCFIIPIYIHIKCYYPNWKEIPDVQEGRVVLAQSYVQSESSVEDLVKEDIATYKKMSVLQSSTGERKKKCQPHDVKSWSFGTRIVVYLILLMIGLVNFGLQIKLIVDSLK